jgi:recombination protein RecA
MAAVARNDRERAKAIELALGQIEKQFGKGSIMRLGGNDVIPQMPSISTGRSAWTMRWASAACRAAA